MRKRVRLYARISGLAIMLLAPAALAHVGQGEPHDFLGGFLHPLTGLDHAFSMIAVGALAWSLGGRARWILPAGFLAVMTAGMISGFEGLVLPHVEAAVAASVGAMGVMLFAGRRLPLALALPLVGLFGIFHGNAHGAEMQADVYAARACGFFVATALLHAVGIALGAAVSQVSKRASARKRAASH